MNILQNPELVDRLAAAYALGTLRGGARRRFEAMARQSPTLRVTARVWQERFMSMTELQKSEQPSPEVWKKIANVLAAEPRAVPAADPMADLLRRARNLWRGAALVAGVAAVAAVTVSLGLRGELEGKQATVAQLQSQLAAQPDVRYVAVLTDDKAAPAMLATFDPRRNTLMLKRVGGYQEGPDKSLQLWAIPDGGAPRSLGVLGEQPVLRMTAAEQVMGASSALAITLEAKGGVPAGSPAAGPVLWKGAVIQTPI
ncbi:anti-sigma factor [Ramlibacter sp. XY19]|uniref:anti-sigma factor n=1 Tax=Ramlibacter paludis TaxID=2908000 RepID=UPI0023DA8958|nr:anti-sigma factor [Ramlibacter paludis]MCG2594253.1 anti-sigma factor [Ramlibacter paludis]